MRSAERGVPQERLATLLGGVLLLLGGWATVRALGVPVNAYDEGLLLTHSALVSTGSVPHRDFYSNYPPGIYLLIDALWKWTGPSPWPLRYLGFGVHVAIAALAGRLAGRALGRPVSLLAAGSVLLWLFPLDDTAYAWLVALAFAFLAFELLLLSRESTSAVAAFACGVALGAVSCFRHDLFVYLVLALAASMAVARPALPSLRRVLVFVAGAALPMLLVWLPLLLRAGPMAIANDLLLDQIRYVNPSRSLPLPWTPLLLGSAVAFALGGPLLAVATWIVRREFAVASAALGLLGALAGAVLPQMLGRSDAFHILFAVTPAVALACVVTQGLAVRVGGRSGVLVLVLGSVLVVLPPALALAEQPLTRPAWNSGPGLYQGLHADADRLAALAFVTRHTRPGEPIYVGRTDHRRVLANEVDFYFFANRPGATRYLQFDPGTVTRDDVQREMVREIEAKGTRLVVLSTCCVWDEPNTSRHPGSARLDEYLAHSFKPVAQYGRYRLLWRHSPAEPAP